MKVYVLIESCCMHFASVFSEQEYQNYKWQDPEEARDYHWQAYEMKDGEFHYLETLPARNISENNLD